MSRFKISRADGKSHSQVILDFVKNAPPGTVFSYEDLADVLSVGMHRTFSIPEVQRIVTSSCPRMLKEQARTLHNIRHTGYRLAPAAYHLALARDRTSKADRQMLRGVQILQNVRWDEMDANQRLAHEGQLLISGALHQQIKALERRQSTVEAAIKKILTDNDDAMGIRAQ